MTASVTPDARARRERPRFRRRTRVLLLLVTFFGLWSWFDLFFPAWEEPEDLRVAMSRVVDPNVPQEHPFRGIHRLTGTIHEPSGLPASNVWVHLHVNGTAYLMETATDGGGTFAFSDLPAGEASLVIGAPGFEPRQVGPYALKAGEVVNVDLEIARRREPVAPILDPPVERDGRPAPRGVLEGRIQEVAEALWLELSPMDPLVRGTRRLWRVEANAGQYRIASVLPGSYRIDVRPDRPGTDPHLLLGRWDGVLVRPQEVTSQDLRLELLPVRGQVLTERRAPLDDVLVLAFHRRGEERAFVGRVRTNKEGRFELPPLPPGDLTFHAMREDFLTARVPASLSAGNALQETVIILYRP